MLSYITVYITVYAHRLRNGTKYWLNNPIDRTISLRLARTNVSEPLSSVMDIDEATKAVKSYQVKKAAASCASPDLSKI